MLRVANKPMINSSQPIQNMLSNSVFKYSLVLRNKNHPAKMDKHVDGNNHHLRDTSTLVFMQQLGPKAISSTTSSSDQLPLESEIPGKYDCPINGPSSSGMFANVVGTVTKVKKPNSDVRMLHIQHRIIYG
jgi:hypothetical protein